MYLQKRRRKWYALHDIPPGSRDALNGRKRFIKSLETEDYQEAKRRAVVWEQRWLRELAKAKASMSGLPASQAARDGEYWKRMMEGSTSDADREIIKDLLIADLDGRLEQTARKQGYAGDPRDLPEADEAVRVYQIATGQLVRTDASIEDWLQTKAGLTPKTLAMYRSDLERLSLRFPYIQDITKATVTAWVTQDLLQQAGMSRKTLDRLLPACRGYWRYLQDTGKAPADVDPFSKLSVQTDNAKAVHPRDRRKGYTPDEVGRLWATSAASDPPLADLIRLGMWTGARISEICSLRVDAVALDHPFPHFQVEDSKTAAGIRTVPVHPELLPTLTRLVETSTDGFVLAGLKPDQYGMRSNAIGKRFGRLKTALGFSAQHSFHSFRHTVITRLLNADVPYPLVAALVGHDTGDNVTLGTYHKGFNLERLTAAMLALEYPSESV